MAEQWSARSGHESTGVPPAQLQARFWNDWNHTYREAAPLDPATRYRAAAVLRTVAKLSDGHARILEIGCGNGWMCVELTRYGVVTGCDLADEVLERSRNAHPEIRFIAGDVLDTDVGYDYDIIVNMEVLAHVRDQRHFARRVAELLKPGGHLVLSTQNRFVWIRHENVAPLGAGQIRRWVDCSELRALLRPYFHIERLMTLLPQGHLGVLRVLNSVKLNTWGGRLVGEERLMHWKELAGLGQAILVHGVKRAPATDV